MAEDFPEDKYAFKPTPAQRSVFDAGDDDVARRAHDEFEAETAFYLANVQTLEEVLPFCPIQQSPLPCQMATEVPFCQRFAKS